MMLVADDFRVVPVTVHVPLRRVPELLTREAVVRAGSAAFETLRHAFGIRAPRLAVAGLNPHAGEDGLLGDEEAAVIRPAIDRLNSRGIDVRGPFPADAMFREAARREYDAAICMYHDQALIPIKTVGFESCVNVTLGLPITRASPGHGVAYDLAGTGRADPGPTVAAIRLAAAMAANRAAE